MMRTFSIVTLIVATALVSGCSSMKKLTGQRDDTVLQGDREPVLPESQTTAKNPDITRQGTAPSSGAAEPIDTQPLEKDLDAPCDPEIQVCDPPAGGTSGTNDGVFSDGQ